MIIYVQMSLVKLKKEMDVSIGKMMVLAFIAGAVSVSTCFGAPVKLKSPDGSITAGVDIAENGQIKYSVSMSGKPVFADSEIGVKLGDKVLGAAVKLLKVENISEKSRYKTRGWHTKGRNYYKGAVIYLHDSVLDMDFAVEFRVFNDAVAYRYVIEDPGHEYKITGETSSWNFARDCDLWSAERSYEGIITKVRLSSVGWNSTLNPPVTAVLPDGQGYVSILEANLTEYCGMKISHPGKNVLTAKLCGAVTVSARQETPWRVAVIAKDLNVLVNTDVITSLCPPPSKELAEADWIKPGRAVWSWWSADTVGPKRQKEYADMAEKLGFEYNVIDWRWDKWPNAWETVADIVDYSKKKGVGVWVWRHSKTLRNPEARNDFFAKAVKAGIVGLKIDFFPPESQATVKYVDELRRDAAKYKLMVNFHGINKPTGRMRTWPNEMTREGIRGHEWWMRGRFKMKPQHDAALPFTRLLAGPGDYTPTSFDPTRLKGQSWGHELAQSIVFTSPLMHFAGDPKILLENPSVDVIRNIQSVWDETVVLPVSKIGDVAAFARRSGKTWIVGVINADKEKELKIDLSFLGRGKYNAVILKDSDEKEAAFVREEKRVSRKDSITFKMRSMGGFAAMFSKK
jgi:alpha-glucosidase